MNTQNLSLIYFSATKTTEQSVKTIAEGIGLPVDFSHNLADDLKKEFPVFGEDDVVVVGAPVYGGRLPSEVAEKLKTLKGNGGAAITVVVFGNRDYDDALLELADILTDAGFRVVAAGAFIGQHSIFPKAGYARPDASDMRKLCEFGERCAAIIRNGECHRPEIKGKRPYKKYGSVPLHPEGDAEACTKCGTCVSHCPNGAIDISSPEITDSGKCISCSRCIEVCPQKVRRYKGFKYTLIGGIFYMAFSKRKEPELFF